MRVAGGHLLDRHAARLGLVQSTRAPNQDKSSTGVAGNRRAARESGRPADGRIDLLTALMHEMGHATGRDPRGRRSTRVNCNWALASGRTATGHWPTGPSPTSGPPSPPPMAARRNASAEAPQPGETGGKDGRTVLSEIRIMCFVFAPKGWALCNGQLLPINQNQALFSLLGTTFGGDGRVNSRCPTARPDADSRRQRAHARRTGRRAGAHAVASRRCPTHTHVPNGSTGDATRLARRQPARVPGARRRLYGAGRNLQSCWPEPSPTSAEARRT